MSHDVNKMDVRTCSVASRKDLVIFLDVHCLMGNICQYEISRQPIRFCSLALESRS